MSDQDLESAARYYLWLAQAFPDLEIQRLNEIIQETERRRKPEILTRAKASVRSDRSGPLSSDDARTSSTDRSLTDPDE